MGRCDICIGDDRLSFTCNECGGTFCSAHRLPEAHHCPGTRKLTLREKVAWSIPELQSMTSLPMSIVYFVWGLLTFPFRLVHNLYQTTLSKTLRLSSKFPIGAILALCVTFLLFSSFVGTGIEPIDERADSVVGESGDFLEGVAASWEESTSRNDTEIRMAIHEEINQIRSERGLPELAYSESVQEIAQGHSDDMAAKDYFSHESPTGVTVQDRFNNHVASCRTYGENIYTTTKSPNSESRFASEVVSGWMDSEDHRENILRGQWDSEGIGIAEGGDMTYVTQNFCG